MIIDAYNNVWLAGGESDCLTGDTYSVEMMLKDMDAAGVDMAACCSLGQMIDNEYLGMYLQNSKLRSLTPLMFLGV